MNNEAICLGYSLQWFCTSCITLPKVMHLVCSVHAPCFFVHIRFFCAELLMLKDRRKNTNKTHRWKCTEEWWGSWEWVVLYLKGSNLLWIHLLPPLTRTGWLFTCVTRLVGVFLLVFSYVLLLTNASLSDQLFVKENRNEVDNLTMFFSV